jgi:hypothetical protein
MEITRGDLVDVSAVMTILGTLGRASAPAQDPLPSTTDKSSSKFVPPEERSAIFDQDVTLCGSSIRSLGLFGTKLLDEMTLCFKTAKINELKSAKAVAA